MRHGTTEWWFLICYLAGITLFVVSAWYLPPSPADLPDDETVLSTNQLSWWVSLSVALLVGVAILSNLSVLNSLPQSGWGSPRAVSLWLVSVALMLLVGVLLRGSGGWPARWGVGALPQTEVGRGLLAVSVVALLILAACARLLWLDKVPLGINPDEGDQGACAIRIIRGNIHNGVFDYGWYFISMVYFHVLAATMQVVGISFVGARILGALCGIVTAGTVTWIGIRHFGYRVGLIAGGLIAVLGIALQFSRETTVAAPTLMLWTLSAAAFLEAARRGSSLAFVLAGLTGGLSIYFYPTGRMWSAVAAMFSVYLLVHGLGGRRLKILRGIVLAAVTALLVTAPFLLRASVNNWGTFTERARQTSIFVKENPVRLAYYHKEWSTARLLRAQIERSLGIFNRYPDMNSFWPTGQPLMPGPLALLTLIGLAWTCLRPRDPRFVFLAIWFFWGFVGVIVTVETPNVHRMCTAIPVLGLLPALVLDSLIRRVENAGQPTGARVRPIVSLAATAAGGLFVLVFMVQQWRFYFGTYGAMDAWSGPTLLGTAVRDQGEDTDVFSMGRQAHIASQGWVRLLAPETPLGGLLSPGSELPVPMESSRNLAIMVTPQQPHYLPYLRDLYPGGTVTPVFDHGQLVCTMYRISKEQRAASLGALVTPPHGEPVRVEHIGEAPPNWSTYPTSMRWSAMWHVPRYWNYALRIGPGPARLAIDGQTVLTVPAGEEVQSTEVALALGDHFVEYDGTLAAPGKSAVLESVPTERPEPGQPQAPLSWHPIPLARLRPVQQGPDGLFGVVTSEGRAEQRRLDGTLATGSLSGQTRIGQLFTTKWTGTLYAPVNGSYAMGLFAQGKIDLRIDGVLVLHTDGLRGEPIEGKVDLQAGPHAVEVVYAVNDGPGGLEWTWTPPGRERSIVPRFALTPPPGAGVGPPVAFDVLGPANQMPVEQPIELGK